MKFTRCFGVMWLNSYYAPRPFYYLVVSRVSAELGGFDTYIGHVVLTPWGLRRYWLR